MPRDAQFKPEKLTLSAVIEGAVTYKFRCPEMLFGWALATVNDATGELQITSDWGNWSHRWNTDHLGAPSLTHFIADRDPGHCDYLANKLWPRTQRERFDLEASIAKARRVLIEERVKEAREWLEYYGDDEDAPDDVLVDPPSWANTRKVRVHGISERWPLSKMTARTIYDELGDIDASTVEGFVDQFFKIAGCEWISEEPWEDVVQYRPDVSYLQLEHGILPALVEACFQRLFPGRHRCQKRMGREDGAGHWRDFHRGHNCHLDDSIAAPAATP